jgi:integrase
MSKGLLTTPIVRDFRHLYACNLYKTTKDIVRVSTALNHSNIAITDTYITDLKRNISIETRTNELVPSISEYNRILTKYKAYRKTDINTTLDALYFISRYGLETYDFYTTKTYAGNTVQLERGFSSIMVNLTSKDMKRLERVIRHYKTSKCLEVSLNNFLKKCYEQRLTDNAYSPYDFRHLYTNNVRSR